MADDDASKLLGSVVGAYLTIKIIDAVIDSPKKSKKKGLFSEPFPKLKF